MRIDNEKKLFDLNTIYRNSIEINDLLSKLTGQKIDDSVYISLPFYSDFGSHIRFGKNIFINKNVTLVDLGGITIEDNVLIGPRTTIITVNHLLEPQHRSGLFVKPVLIKKNVWLGANVTVLSGVTIGENSVVAAGSVVTKSIPDNSIVAGIPAQIVKSIVDKND